MIIKFSDLPKLRKRFRDKKIVFAGGTFDLIHKGHVAYLENLKRLGDIVIIAISTDKRVRERKGKKRPINAQSNRLAVINAMRHVDYCLIAPNRKKDHPIPTIRIVSHLKPDLLVSIDKKWKKFANRAMRYGTKVKILPASKVHSSTRIINKILKTHR